LTKAHSESSRRSRDDNPQVKSILKITLTLTFTTEADDGDDDDDDG
jgi:hypothetical protein